MSIYQTYPFSALVGQAQMQLALLLNAINPAIGGVLIRGHKGTAKSTAARALPQLLPPVTVTELDVELRTNDQLEYIFLPRSQRVPFVELPIGASDDRVVGTLNIERALQAGERQFEMGLLGQAHQGVLYVDEVNLLSDHIVDVLLDVAASGINTVEREGISASHPANFILIGTMNPEEGELRPQLLDRFGLAVEVSGQMDAPTRKQVVKRRLAFDANRANFCAEYQPAEADLSQRISQARERLGDVVLSEAMLDVITHVCAGSGVDGLRADITMCKTAQTIATWQDEASVTLAHIRQAAELVLPHRRRRQPFESPGVDQQQLDQLLNEAQETYQPDTTPDDPASQPPQPQPRESNQPATEGE